MSHLDQFRQAMLNAGLTPPDELIDDGNVHRFSTNGKKQDRSGWYHLHGDATPAGEFGCWRQGFTQGWCAKSADSMTEAERQAHRQRIEAMKGEREKATREAQSEAATQCAELWRVARDCKAGEHPYLVNKGIKPYGIKILGQGEAARLVIPMRINGDLVSLQFIGADGTKRFKAGGAKAGAYCAIGKPNGRLIVCEGFATGASIHEATGQAVAVAFDAGNLGPVSKALRGKYPDLQLIVAADDDRATEGNPGLSKATEAAQAIGALLAVPQFNDNRPAKATDFNDLHQHQGLMAVNQSIEQAKAPEGQPVDEAKTRRKTALLISASHLQPRAFRWLWRDWLAKGQFYLLAGDPGQGKTTIAMTLAATVSMGGRWPDGSRPAVGNVLVWSGEDDAADTLIPRLMAAGADRSRCHFIQGTQRGPDGEVIPFDPSSDMPALREAIESLGGVDLIVIDPVVSAVAGDSHKAAEVRKGLQPVVDLAARCDCAVLGITHFGKGGTDQDPAKRVLGSVGFTAVARFVHAAARVKTPEGDTRRLVRVKANSAPLDVGYEYTITPVDLGHGIVGTRIEWGQAVEGASRELLADAPEADAGDDSEGAATDLDGLLRDVLVADGWTPSDLASRALKGQGYTDKQIRAARCRIKVISRRFGGLGSGGRFYWRLPVGDDPAPPDDQNSVKHLPENLQNSVKQFAKKGGESELLEGVAGPANLPYLALETPNLPNLPTQNSEGNIGKIGEK